MKHGKRPTRRQKQEIKRNGSNPENWLVERDTNETMVIVHRLSGNKKCLNK